MGNQDSSTRSHDGSLELQEGPWYGGGLGWLLHSDRFAVQRWWVSVMINDSQWWPMGEWSPGTPFQYLAAWPEGSECTGQVGNSTNYSELFRNVSNTNKGLQHGILTCGNSWLLYPKSWRKGTSQWVQASLRVNTRACWTISHTLCPCTCSRESCQSGAAAGGNTFQQGLRTEEHSKIFQICPNHTNILLYNSAHLAFDTVYLGKLPWFPGVWLVLGWDAKPSCFVDVIKASAPWLYGSTVCTVCTCPPFNFFCLPGPFFLGDIGKKGHDAPNTCLRLSHER